MTRKQFLDARARQAYANAVASGKITQVPPAHAQGSDFINMWTARPRHGRGATGSSSRMELTRVANQLHRPFTAPNRPNKK